MTQRCKPTWAAWARNARLMADRQFRHVASQGIRGCMGCVLGVSEFPSPPTTHSATMTHSRTSSSLLASIFFLVPPLPLCRRRTSNCCVDNFPVAHLDIAHCRLHHGNETKDRNLLDHQCCILDANIVRGKMFWVCVSCSRAAISSANSATIE